MKQETKDDIKAIGSALLIGLATCAFIGTLLAVARFDGKREVDEQLQKENEQLKDSIRDMKIEMLEIATYR